MFLSKKNSSTVSFQFKSFDGWLSHGQSCQIFYLYIAKHKNSRIKTKRKGALKFKQIRRPNPTACEVAKLFLIFFFHCYWREYMFFIIIQTITYKLWYINIWSETANFGNLTLKFASILCQISFNALILESQKFS